MPARPGEAWHLAPTLASAGIGTPKIVGQQSLSIGAVCVCELVTENRAGSSDARSFTRRATSVVM